ncbi:MAG TPA: GDSL-type esterase/lipase family protein, partial [Pirellulales bacterium]|nr:GDSL-type esterase/lipase family protein [Pirellulales bacterium]
MPQYRLSLYSGQISGCESPRGKTSPKNGGRAVIRPAPAPPFATLRVVRAQPNSFDLPRARFKVHERNRRPAAICIILEPHAMKPFAWLNFATLLLGLIASAGTVDAAAAAMQPVSIVAFGDSTTAARGSTTVYATILQEELRGVRVINAGVGGNSTEMARKRFEADVLSQRPRIAIIQFGINDAAVDVWKTPPATQPRVSLERYEANLRSFVRSL